MEKTLWTTELMKQKLIQTDSPDGNPIEHVKQTKVGRHVNIQNMPSHIIPEFQIALREG